jgi:WXXGXW repeat (2 copies)
VGVKFAGDSVRTKESDAMPRMLKVFALAVTIAVVSAFAPAGTPLIARSVVEAQVSLGIRIGPPPAARVIVQPPSPGVGYQWIGGYWYPVGGRYRWHNGYWSRPVYAGARWVAPRHDGVRFYAGYWDGDHGRFEHDHRWDRNGNRDFGRYR